MLSLFSPARLRRSATKLASQRERDCATEAEEEEEESDRVEERLTAQLLRDHFLSFVYPLVDLYVAGPNAEEGGKFSLTLTRIDGQKMRSLRRDEESELFTEYAKNGLSLLFDNLENANLWKNKLASHVLLQAVDALPLAPLTYEERRKARSSVIGSVTGKNRDAVEVPETSILSHLVLPTSGCDAKEAERIKIQIAETLSVSRKM